MKGKETIVESEGEKKDGKAGKKRNGGETNETERQTDRQDRQTKIFN